MSPDPLLAGGVRLGMRLSSWVISPHVTKYCTVIGPHYTVQRNKEVTRPFPVSSPDPTLSQKVHMDRALDYLF